MNPENHHPSAAMSAMPAVPDFRPLQTALCDAGARALHAMVPLALTLSLYRSVAAMARALRQARADAGLSLGLTPDLIALLAVVRDAACEHLTDPSLPHEIAIQLHRAIGALARAAHLARPEPEQRETTCATIPLQPGEPPIPNAGPSPVPEQRETACATIPLQPGEPPIPNNGSPPEDEQRETACPTIPLQPGEPPIDTCRRRGGEEPTTPLQPGEPPIPNNRPLPDDEPISPKSAWRNDHTDPRDKAAHERLKIVLEDRVWIHARKEAQRLIAEKAARFATGNQNGADAPDPARLTRPAARSS